ncbi:MAG TPA: hypothetical protein VFS77_11755 [Pyrinomonadaceae bacterium]|nr:hypothetical protein [Pyrinomonadaceae bacterium]
MATSTIPPGTKTTSTIIKLKVHFELNTPNGLRKVIFGLEKDATAGNVVSWSIDFQLFERAKKTDPWGDAIVTLNVDVQKALFPKAEKAAQGLTPGQSAHALGPAADDAKAAADGEIDEEEAQDTVQNTLKKK